MKENLSTRIKRNLSRIKALYIFITDVYLSLDSEGPATDVWIYRRNCKIDKYLLASLLYNVNDVS